MGVEEDKLLFHHFLYWITGAAVVGLPLVVCIFKYCHVGGGKSGWGKTNGHKSFWLSVAGVFPIWTVWATGYVLLQNLSEDEAELEQWGQFWCLMTALSAAALTKVLSALCHPKVQWWYCRKKMVFMKSTIRQAADVYLVIVTGWELIGNLADDKQSWLLKSLPNHGLCLAAIWGALVLLEDLKTSMKEHDDAEKSFYNPKRKKVPSLKRYFTCINEGTTKTVWGDALSADVEGAASGLLGGKVSEKKKAMLEFVTVNNVVTLVQLLIAALTGEGMVLISCLIKMSSNSELEHDAFIEEEEEDEPTVLERAIA